MLKKSKTAEIIISALPYIRKFHDKVFVIKYGGSAQSDESLKADFARDVVLLHMVGIKVIIIHGGGQKINQMLDRLSIASDFLDGLRVTTKEAMEIVEMVLSGTINKEITSLLTENGANAIGLSGKDSKLITANVLDDGKYGFVGEVSGINTELIYDLLDDGYIPVIASIATDDKNESYNINADLCASSIAKALKADKILFLSDIDGVLDKDRNLISKLDKNLIENLKKDGTIHGGMIPKINACLECIDSGVKNAHIINGKISHSILLELFTDDGIGSVIKGEL